MKTRILAIALGAVVLSNCSKDLTRPKVEDLLKAEKSFTEAVSELPLQYNGRIRGDEDAGVVEGLWLAGGQFTLTEKGRRFFSHDFSGSQLAALKEPAQRKVIEVTGITAPAVASNNNIKVAQFTWRYDGLSDVAARYTGEAGVVHSGEAAFQLFDDGWRLGELHLNEGDNRKAFEWSPELEQELQKQKEARRLTVETAQRLAAMGLKDYEPVTVICPHPAWNLHARNPITGQTLSDSEELVKSVQRVADQYKVSLVGVDSSTGYFQVGTIVPPSDWVPYERKERFSGCKTYALYQKAEVHIATIDSPGLGATTATASASVTYIGPTPALEMAKALVGIGPRAMAMVLSGDNGEYRNVETRTVYFAWSRADGWRATGVR